ncbi:hypothetical protein Cch02nite_62780 [Catellatospora chokoriensis]|uniref:Uncharacterized protein n=1 Tax=Catellatospora chokoriensis TaxID=310353 RepID=A0A8J3K2H7_9ACTN|nr:hypothetical protein Cch02nite_62780 [Catellatospora chokoriensis]
MWGVTDVANLKNPARPTHRNHPYRSGAGGAAGVSVKGRPLLAAPSEPGGTPCGAQPPTISADKPQA